MRLLSILLLAAVAYAADPREAEIHAALAAFDKCWDARDTECLSKEVTDDFVQITRAATLRSKTTFLEGMKAGRYSQTDPNNPPKIRDMNIRFYGITAIQTFTFNGPVGPGREMLDHFETFVWVKVDGRGWLLASMHVSLPRATPAPQAPK